MELNNGAEGGPNGATVTTANSGGLSGNAFDAVSIGTGAAATFDTAHAYGSRAYKIVSGSSTTHLDWTSGSVGTLTEAWGRLYLYAMGNPAAEVALLRLRRSGAQTARIGVLSGGQITLRQADNSLVATSAATITLGGWTRLEWHCIPVTSNGTIECRIYTSADSATIVETAASTTAAMTAGLDEIHWGPVGNESGYTYWFDALNLNNVGFPGPVGGRRAAPVVSRQAVVRTARW